MIGSVRSAKLNFFDRARVQNSMNRATAKAFREFGRLVRKRSQASLQVRPGSSAPGRPPHIHKSLGITRTSKSTGRTRRQSVSPLREFIFFAMTKDSVVIGPAKLNKPANLKALEEGGESLIVQRGRTRAVNIVARPFMRPAFEAEMPAARLWRNAMK